MKIWYGIARMARFGTSTGRLTGLVVRRGLYAVLLLVLLCSRVGYSLAQSKVVDSLETALNSIHKSHERIEILTTLSKLYQKIDLVRAQSCADQALQLSDNAGINDFRARIYASMGDIAVMNDSLELAREYYEASLKFFQQDENDAGLIGVYLILGNIAMVQNRLVDALDHYRTAIRYSESAGREEWLDNLYNNIGNIDIGVGNHVEAQDTYALALEKAIEQGDSMMMVIIYSNLGLTSIELMDTARARGYLEHSQKLAKSLGLSYEVANNYFNFSLLEYAQGNYQNANRQMFKALRKLGEDDLSYAGPKGTLFAEYYSKMGQNYLALGQLDSATHYYRISMSLGKANSQLEILANTAMGLSGVHEARGMLDSSLYYYKLHKVYADSILNEENIKKLTYLDASYRFEENALKERQEREKTAMRESQRTYVMIAIILILVFALASLVFLLTLGLRRVKLDEMEQVSLKNELEMRNKELTTHVLYQLRKNEFILNIIEKLKGSVKNLLPENKKVIESVIRELDKDYGDEIWKEFEVRFQQVHTDFYKNLVEKFPDMTTNELRLSAFLKLNMSTKDIAAITFQSINSIDVARSRLRQKFGLSKEENLSAFLSQF